LAELNKNAENAGLAGLLREAGAKTKAAER
jgi:hypothetical protein